ncbi:MerR family transcriptional regulator [Phreatobacter stygius]|uniref:MerR family transcriptional regulator n=1 Tax=Phreatobacter stygius TaxID=1940610 RepID=A0A4D7BGB9_9HYPH|nr:MerR family transcriptional regulator [Phreatobacter stygius]QCI66902.1 MerR family transcriptional regulator [Phreatobacter stygius]
MKLYTVKQLGRLSGVTVRTLHHYDAIGLLKPASVGPNGYRYYGRDELLRLQDILLMRDMRLPLDRIAAALAAGSADRRQALRRHRERLIADIERYHALIATLDRTIADLEGGEAMPDQDLYQGFAPPRQAEYETYLTERYGATALDESKQRLKGGSKQAFERHLAELADLEAEIVTAMKAKLDAEAAAVQDIIGRHHAWVDRHWTADRASYAGLGRLYLDHPDFRARYEAQHPAMAQFLAKAMAHFAERSLPASA